MKTISISLVLVLQFLFGSPEEQGMHVQKNTGNTVQAYNRQEPETIQKIHQSTDTIHASFPGGDPALTAFLKDNIVYPYNPEDRPYTGKIQVTLVVASTGRIPYYSILNSPNKSISSEIKRVVKLMPQWTPASSKGIAIADSVKIWFPFVYKKE